MRERLTYAAYGVLATLLGVAAGHLVASLNDPASSPVLAVGSTVIDLTPTPVKEWAVAQFGTKDKPILIGSVFAGVLVLVGRRGRPRSSSLPAGRRPSRRSWSRSPGPPPCLGPPPASLTSCPRLRRAWSGVARALVAGSARRVS